MIKKFNYLFILLVSFLFIPRVYASLNYDIILDVGKTSVEKGSLVEVKVSLDNITGENQGIGACVMNISFDTNILLDSKIRTLNSWTLTTGDKYLFDTGNFVFSKSEMFVIPIKVNGNGNLKLFNIFCSDGENEIATGDKEIRFTIIENKPNNNSDNQIKEDNDSNNNDNTNQDNNLDEVMDSNANLSNIILSEGVIEFDPNVTEYSIEVNDFSKLQVTPELESDRAQSVIDRNITDSGNSILITVTAENGDTKVYTIYVSEKVKEVDESNSNNNVYVPIFIGIICVLVIINIIRIIKSKKR